MSEQSQGSDRPDSPTGGWQPPQPPPPTGWQQPPPGWQPPSNFVQPPSPPKKKRRLGLIIVAIVVGVPLLLCVGVISMIAGTGGEPASVTDEAVTEGTTAAKGPQPEPTAAGLNQPIRDGKFEFVAHEVRCGVKQIGDQNFGTKAQGQFCLVTLSVTNIGDEPQTFMDDDQYAYDAQGRKHSADSWAGILANDDQQVWINEINPGNTIKGKVVFDIPVDVALSKLELHDSTFSGGVEVTL